MKRGHYNVGKNNARWRGGRSCGFISKTSLEVKGQREKCEICGISKEELNKRMYIHHKDGNRLNNSPENLEVECPSCHAKRHNRIKHIKWMQRRKEEKNEKK